jgi:hypothetical protein
VVKLKLFVEGGGESKALRAECREAFNTWLRGAGLQRFPRIVASGSRNDAFNDFKTALANGEAAMLLVDSEDRIAADYALGEPAKWLPWAHLKSRDGWDKPLDSADLDCHLMVQCMENWFLGDVDQLKKFFGQGFKDKKLPATRPSLEATAKADVLAGLKLASANCATKSPYGKGAHSFKILKILDAKLIIAAAPWAKRFAEEMQKRFP